MGAAAGIQAVLEASSNEDMKAVLKKVPGETRQRILSALSSFDRREQLNIVFDACDDNKNGFLSLKEYQQLAQNYMFKRSFKKLFDKMDSSEDNKVTKAEWAEYQLESCKEFSDDVFRSQMAEWIKRAGEVEVMDERRQQLHSVFDACDDNHNGFLSLKEYQQLAQSYMFKRSFKKLFEKMDSSEDNKVTKTEWTEYQLESCKEFSDDVFKKQMEDWLKRAGEVEVMDERREELNRVFDACDDNNNGFLSLKEYEQLAQRYMFKQSFKTLFEKMDSSEDNKVTKAEWAEYQLESCKELSDDGFKKQMAEWLKRANEVEVDAAATG